MFKRETGRVQGLPLTNAVSTVYSKNALVYPNGSGAFIPADATSGNHVGVTLEEITSDDDRYSTAGKIMVDLIRPGDVFRATVTGTLTAAKEGTYMDLSDSVTVDAGNTSKNVVFCVKYISATEGLFMINALASVANVATT